MLGGIQCIEDYIKANNITLCVCPWCGSPAKPVYEECLDYRYDDCMPVKIGNQYKITCTDADHNPARGRTYDSVCRISTVFYSDRNYNQNGEFIDPIKKCIDVWNSGEVSIPLYVTVPSNHIILQRYEIPGQKGHYLWKKHKMVLKISKQRGIFNHFVGAFDFLKDGDGFLPCRFKLLFPNETMQVSLDSVGKDYSNNDQVTFTIHHADEYHITNGRDTAWLKKKPTKPLIYSRMMEKIQKSADEPEHED